MNKATLFNLDSKMIDELQTEVGISFNVKVSSAMPFDDGSISAHDFCEMQLDDDAKCLVYVEPEHIESCIQHLLSQQKEKPTIDACFVVARNLKGNWKTQVHKLPLVHNFLKGYKTKKGGS